MAIAPPTPELASDASRRRRWAAKFGCALRGLVRGVRTQTSFAIHVAVALIVIALAGVLGCSYLEWGLLLLCIAGVLTCEMINTAIERLAKTFDELKTLRFEKSRGVIGRIQAKLLVEYPRSRPKSLKRKAIEYLMKRWPGFTLFLEDVRLPLSNNEAERTIRHAVIGRKNYHGSNNHTGAETAATHFTIIESCKKNEVDPRQFILMSLKKIADGEPVMTPLEYAKSIRMPDAAKSA